MLLDGYIDEEGDREKKKSGIGSCTVHAPGFGVESLKTYFCTESVNVTQESLTVDGRTQTATGH